MSTKYNRNILLSVIFKIVGIFSLLCWLGVILVVRDNVGGLREQWADKPIFSHLIFQRGRTEQLAKALTLNFIVPTFNPMARHISSHQGDPREFTRGYVSYYEKVVENFPQISEAWGMLGYCYFYQENQGQAINALKKAVELNPYFYWSHYNLAVVYYNRQEYALSADSLKRALSLKPEGTLMTISRSRVYQQIIYGQKNLSINIKNNLQKGYQDAGRLLSLCLSALTYESHGKTFIPEESFDLVVF